MKREITRQREHGRQVTVTTSGEQRLSAIRQIVTDRSFAKVDGMAVDLFTANAIVTVFDALNAENQKTFLNLSVSKMARVSFKLLK